MEQSAQALRQLSQKARQMSDARADRVVAFLVAEEGPQKTAEAVEARTGIKAATVRQWIARDSAPSFTALFRLMVAYGPEVLSAALEKPPKWLDQAARAERQRKLKAQIEALQDQLERA